MSENRYIEKFGESYKYVFGNYEIYFMNGGLYTITGENINNMYTLDDEWRKPFGLRKNGNLILDRVKYVENNKVLKVPE
jgi:hypothetical protein